MTGKKIPLIHIPEGVTENGVVEDIDTAVKQAVIAIPIVMAEILDRMESIAASLEWVEDFCKRRGQSEGLFTPDELEDRHDEGAPDEINGD